MATEMEAPEMEAPKMEWRRSRREPRCERAAVDAGTPKRNRPS